MILLNKANNDSWNRNVALCLAPPRDCPCCAIISLKRFVLAWISEQISGLPQWFVLYGRNAQKCLLRCLIKGTDKICLSRP